MEKKTNKLVYVILGIAVLLCIALVPFSAMRREYFLAEGDSALADFCITMRLIGLIGSIVFIGIIFLLLLKDIKTKKKQTLFAQELRKTPLFERWFLSEEEQIKENHRAPRILIGVLSLPIIISMGYILILILDGTGGMIMMVFSFLFCIFVICFSWWISDYRKQYMRSLWRTVSEQLPSPAEKEAFADQLLGNRAKTFPYQGGPQSAASMAWVTEDYSYFRQFRKCRIIRNSDMDRVILKKGSYAAGLGAHFRTCYIMEIYVNNGQKQIWQGYFYSQEKIYSALEMIRKGGISEVMVEDRVRQ